MQATPTGLWAHIANIVGLMRLMSPRYEGRDVIEASDSGGISLVPRAMALGWRAETASMRMVGVF
jgi:hypothetical protein